MVEEPPFRKECRANDIDVVYLVYDRLQTVEMMPCALAIGLYETLANVHLKTVFPTIVWELGAKEGTIR